MSKLIVGNLKMNLLTLAERDRYIESFEREIGNVSLGDTSIVLCPPAVHIEKFAEKLSHENVSIGAQNIFWEERGSFTGEISASMIKNIGCNYVIVGHSERKKYFSETDEFINAKVRAALQNNLTPIVCVGETLEERRFGETAKVISSQITKFLAEVPISKVGEIIFAYEPIWAVGSDATPNNIEILEVKIILKKIIAEIYGLPVSEKARIIYGGSVNSKTVAQVCIDPKMDGVLVGRESLIPNEFIKIAEIIDKA